MQRLFEEKEEVLKENKYLLIKLEGYERGQKKGAGGGKDHPTLISSATSTPRATHSSLEPPSSRHLQRPALADQGNKANYASANNVFSQQTKGRENQ